MSRDVSSVKVGSSYSDALKRVKTFLQKPGDQNFKLRGDASLLVKRLNRIRKRYPFLKVEINRAIVKLAKTENIS